MVAKPRRIIAYIDPVPSGGEAVAKYGTSPQVLLAYAVIESAVRSMKVEYAAGLKRPDTKTGKEQRRMILDEIENGSLEFWCDVAGTDWDCVRVRLYEIARERGLL